VSDSARPWLPHQREELGARFLLPETTSIALVSPAGLSIRSNPFGYLLQDLSEQSSKMCFLLQSLC